MIIYSIGMLVSSLLLVSMIHGYHLSQPVGNRRIISSSLLQKRHHHILKNQIQEFDFLEPSLSALGLAQSSSFFLNEEIVGFSNLSFYFTLFLYVVSLPGLFSLVTRAVKASPAQQRVYDIPGPANPTAKTVRQVAAEILAYFKALNYEANAGEEVITFRGILGKSRSQAAFLTFCTLLSLASLGLVLSVLFPDLGVKAYLVTLLSPYAGIYYWNNAQRVDEVKVKIEISDDEQVLSVIAQGEKEDLERFSKTLNLPERGKIYVKGIFESDDKKDVINYIALDKKKNPPVTSAPVALTPLPATEVTTPVNAATTTAVATTTIDSNSTTK